MSQEVIIAVHSSIAIHIREHQFAFIEQAMHDVLLLHRRTCLGLCV